MVEDHTKAGVELKQIAEKKSIPVPSAMDDKHQKVYDQLQRLSGPEFDKAYMRTMASDHDDAVKLFKQQSEHGQDAELKSFAMKTLPVIEKHDDMAHMDKKELQKE
jgi:putative membrane protein